MDEDDEQAICHAKVVRAYIKANIPDDLKALTSLTTAVVAVMLEMGFDERSLKAYLQGFKNTYKRMLAETS
jgi:UDP-N-acetylmuramate-alanine ligase